MSETDAADVNSSMSDSEELLNHQPQQIASPHLEKVDHPEDITQEAEAATVEPSTTTEMNGSPSCYPGGYTSMQAASKLSSSLPRFVPSSQILSTSVSPSSSSSRASPPFTSSQQEQLSQTPVKVPRQTHPQPSPTVNMSSSKSATGQKRTISMMSSPLAKLQDIVQSAALESSSSVSPMEALNKLYTSTTMNMSSPRKYQAPTFHPPITAVSKTEHSHMHMTPRLEMSMNHNSNRSHLKTSASSTFSTPVPRDQNEPLDLSVKRRKLSPSSPGAADVRSSEASNFSPLLYSSPESSSSLANLTKRFGGNSFLMDNTGLKGSGSTSRRPYISTLGGSLFTSALYGSAPLVPPPVPPMKERFNQMENMVSPRKTYSSQIGVGSVSPARSQIVSKPSSTVTTVSTDTPRVATTSTTSSTSSTTPSSSVVEETTKKHTNHVCICQKEFNSLYHLTVHLKESGHPAANNKPIIQAEYPKLVRGQDMWLNQGSEQTRQILRCMQCGESFKSLPELTVHMIQTKHYTNIVGSEASKKLVSSAVLGETGAEGDGVFKCKICEDMFDGMDSLAKHMLATGHHKKHHNRQLLGTSPDRSLGEEDISCSPPVPRIPDDRLITPPLALSSPREPPANFFAQDMVVKQEPLSDHESDDANHNPIKQDVNLKSNESVPESKICCENCGKRIETSLFVDHVRQCLRENPSKSDEEYLSSDDDYYDLFPRLTMGHIPVSSRDHKIGNSLSKEYLHDEKHQKEYLHDVKPHNQPLKLVKKEFTPSEEKDNTQCSVLPPSSNFLKGDSLTAEGSALKAMESFIERSFITPSKTPSGQTSARKMVRNTLSTEMQVMPPSPGSPRERANSVSSDMGVLGNNLSDGKYLPPYYAPSVHKYYGKPHFGGKLTPPVSPAVSAVGSPLVKDDNRGRESVESKDEKPSDTVDSRPAASPDTEMPVKEEEKPCLREVASSDSAAGAASSADEVDKSAASALQSLQGLVYGKSFNTEHPLDSLQKLIHTTHGVPCVGINGGAQTVLTGKATIQPGIPGTVILVNPIVTVVPSSTAPPQVHISMPGDRSSSPPLVPHNDKDSASGSENGLLQDHKLTEAETEALLDAESDQPGEYQCQACKRTFASKGSYRYHLSRCHLSSAVKRYGIKDMINTTPYIYLPLDHSSKFNKYYEMANELANKTK